MSIFRFKSPRRSRAPVKDFPSPVISSPTSSTEMQPILIAENINPIGMSYWRNINFHYSLINLVVFLSINDELMILTIDKNTLNVLEIHPLGIHHTGEGCYFSASADNILYVPIEDTLYRVNIFMKEKFPVWTVHGKKLWQCHSSWNDKVHSATIKDSNYNPIFWGVFNENTEITTEISIQDEPDECQIDKSGEYLIIKEANYNRIYKLSDVTKSEKIITDEAGALGHSDTGFGCALGENDHSQKPGALDLINLETLESRNVCSTGIWNMGYVSFTNAKPGIPTDEQKCLITTPNELLSITIGTGEVSFICPALTEDTVKYEHRAKANLCPLGQFAIWTALVGGQINAYMVRIPNW